MALKLAVANITCVSIYWLNRGVAYRAKYRFLSAILFGYYTEKLHQEITTDN